MNTPPSNRWKHLARKPGSPYRQLFISGRNIAARTLYGLHVNADEPRAAEQIAKDYGLPLEAVLEAIAYCQSNPPELHQDWEADEALAKATGMDDPEYYKHGAPKRLSPQDQPPLRAS